MHLILTIVCISGLVITSNTEAELMFIICYPLTAEKDFDADKKKKQLALFKPIQLSFDYS